MKKKTLLIEIYTEELPAKSLLYLIHLFYMSMFNELKNYGFFFKEIQKFATPRRLALRINELFLDLDSLTQDKKKLLFSIFILNTCKKMDRNSDFRKKYLEKRLDHNLSLNYNDLIKIETIDYKKYLDLISIETILKKLIKNSLKKFLSNLLLMRWNEKNFRFVRPVRNILLLLDTEVVNLKLFGLDANRNTFSHFYMLCDSIEIMHAKEYASILKRKGWVIANYEIRKNLIVNRINKITQKLNGIVKINNSFLEEVTSLVEWPEVFYSSFPIHFLSIPDSIIVHTMMYHQKIFPVFNRNGCLTNYFIFVSNIKSKEFNRIILGNKKVITARLADARFFFNIDRRRKLVQFLIELKKVTFLDRLGSLYDRTIRLIKLVIFFCNLTNIKRTIFIRTALLSKCDLVTSIVKEFPEMQGTIGMTYALLDKEDKRVSLALKEQYAVIISKNRVPKSNVSNIFSLIDRIDMLVGIFIAKKKFNSKKDPFGMRRLAIGLIFIIIKERIDISVSDLVEKSISLYNITNSKKRSIKNEVMNFLEDRFFNICLKMNYNRSIINSVISIENRNFYLIEKKISLINLYFKSNLLNKLVILYKRLFNFLKKKVSYRTVKKEIFLTTIEKRLFVLNNVLSKRLKVLLRREKYKNCLFLLIKLEHLVHEFFKQVLVNHNDIEIRSNRLNLLKESMKVLALFIDFSFF